MSAVHNSVETVNAAATAIVTAESRVQPTTHRKKRWGSCLNLYKCFKSQTHSPKKHNHSALAPEPLIPLPRAHQPGSLPISVPPSTPFQSDPPSATRTPIPTTPPSPPVPFATCRPYANETNPVSPPVPFSTEPSTASFTPPVDSSPDVPYNLTLSQHDFRPYQEGSPIRNLVSPNSVVSNSGTNSPYLDKSFSLKFHIGEVPKLLSLENFSIRNWAPRDPVADVASLAISGDDVAANHRLSFETSREEERDKAEEEESGSKRCYRSISFGSIKEFDFDNPKGEFPERSEWWANEKIIGEDLDAQNNWTFFPLLKSGVA